MNTITFERQGGKVSFSSMAFCEKTVELPEDFVPSSKDIICGRGKNCYDHVGNKRFRVTIAMNLKRYVNAKTKVDKSQVVHSIVEDLRESSAVGGFVKKNHVTGRWMAVNDYLAREKVGHALRDALNSIKRAQRQNPYKVEKDKEETLYEAEQTIFKSLDLYRGGYESPDDYESKLNASFDAYEPDPSASFVFPV